MTKKKDPFSNFSATICVDGQERSLTYKSKGITGGMQIYVNVMDNDKLINAITVICESRINGENIITVESAQNPKIFRLEY